MKRNFLLLSIIFSQLFFTQTFAATSYFNTILCKVSFGSAGCDQTLDGNTNANTYTPTSFSFSNFFDSWKNPWASDNFQPVNTQTPVAQTGGISSPSTVGVDTSSGVKATDFGVATVADTATPVFKTPTQIAAEENLFKVLVRCSASISISDECKTDIAAAQARVDSTKTSTTLAGQTTPRSVTNSQNTQGSEYSGAQTNDNLVGTQSPNYDSGEDNHINSGPLERGAEDSQIKQSAQNFNGSQYFVNRGTGSCANFGIDVGGSCPDAESYQSDFKSTVSNLCSNLTGKRLKITSGNRSVACNARVGGASGSSHMSGLAMDTRLDNYSNDEKVLIVMYLAAQGFNNFGGYGANAAMHFDMRSSVNRWGPNYSISSCEARLFPDYFRKAMAIMGSEPCQRDSQLRQKAINALKKMGKDNFTTPANTKVTR
jgi:hypothetical protein